MEAGSNKGLYTLIAIVVFGIFLSLSYFIFQDQFQTILAAVMAKTSTSASVRIENDGLLPLTVESLTYTNNGTYITLTDYDGSCGTDVIIPKYIDGLPVTTIGNKTFFNKGLTSLMIPDTVTTIQDGYYNNGALQNCYGAFGMNHNLIEISLPDSLTYIGTYAFGDNRIKSLILPDSVTEVKVAAFCRNGLEYLKLSENLKIIRYDAFWNNALTSLIIPNSVTVIESCAFHGAGSAIKELIIPASVTSIGPLAFDSDGITKLTFEEGIKTIDCGAFSNCKLTSLTIPRSVTSLKYDLVRNNPSLNTIKIPISLKPKIDTDNLIIRKLLKSDGTSTLYNVDYY